MYKPLHLRGSKRRVQLVSVSAGRSPCCTLSLVVTRSLSPPCYFCWLFSIIVECQRSLVWSDKALESIVGVCYRCQCSMSFLKTGLPKWSWLWSISAFLDLWSFKYYIYCIGVVCSRIVSKSFCLRTVQCSFCVLVHTVSLCTSSLVAPKSFWSLCDFSWIHNINMNLQISFIWSKAVRKSIVGVVCCCPLACHSCSWGLSKVPMFGSILYFLGSWVFEYCIYCIEMIYWRNMYKPWHVRTVQCSL